MKLLDRHPCSVLAPYVESYWYVETSANETDSVPDATLPNGTCNLIFHLSDYPHHEYDAESLEVFCVLETCWFTGARERALVVGPTVCTRVIGIRFKPGGLIPCARTPASEAAGLTAEPEDLQGSVEPRLLDQSREQSYTEPAGGTDDLVEAQYSCAKSDLRPLYDARIAAVTGRFGRRGLTKEDVRESSSFEAVCPDTAVDENASRRRNQSRKCCRN